MTSIWSIEKPKTLLPSASSSATFSSVGTLRPKVWQAALPMRPTSTPSEAPAARVTGAQVVVGLADPELHRGVHIAGGDDVERVDAELADGLGDLDLADSTGEDLRHGCASLCVGTGRGGCLP